LKPQEHGTDQEKHDSNSLPEIPGARIISYNMNEHERPAGLKIRFKVRIVSGKAAAAIDARQAQAIRELLAWVRQQRMQPEPPSR
jgi:hypothetical protein